MALICLFYIFSSPVLRFSPPDFTTNLLPFSLCQLSAGKLSIADLRFDLVGIDHNFSLAVERILYTSDVFVNGRVLLQSCQASVKKQLIVLIVCSTGVQPSSSSRTRELSSTETREAAQQEVSEGGLVGLTGLEGLLVLVSIVVVLLTGLR